MERGSTIGESAQRPEQDFVAFAVAPSSRQGVPELMEQDRSPQACNDQQSVSDVTVTRRPVERIDQEREVEADGDAPVLADRDSCVQEIHERGEDGTKGRR